MDGVTTHTRHGLPAGNGQGMFRGRGGTTEVSEKRLTSLLSSPFTSQVEQQVPSLVNTSENFVGGKVAGFLPGWKRLTSDPWNLKQVIGVDVQICEDPMSVVDQKEVKFSSQEEKLVENGIDKLCKKDVVQVVESCSDQVLSILLFEKSMIGPSA